MIRAITIVSAFLLAASSIVHADDRESALLNLRFKQQQMHGFDMNMSRQEYEAVSRHNKRFVRKTLRSYTNGALNLIGVSEKAVNIIGTAVGLANNKGGKLNLNKSKTLTLELKDVGDSERTSLYFGVNLDW